MFSCWWVEAVNVTSFRWMLRILIHYNSCIWTSQQIDRVTMKIWLPNSTWHFSFQKSESDTRWKLVHLYWFSQMDLSSYLIKFYARTPKENDSKKTPIDFFCSWAGMLLAQVSDSSSLFLWNTFEFDQLIHQLSLHSFSILFSLHRLREITSRNSYFTTSTLIARGHDHSPLSWS